MINSTKVPGWRGDWGTFAEEGDDSDLGTEDKGLDAERRTKTSKRSNDGVEEARTSSGGEITYLNIENVVMMLHFPQGAGVSGFIEEQMFSAIKCDQGEF